MSKAVDAILVELDYKGYYSRFALTEKEFQERYPKTYEEFASITESNSYTLRPMVHIWFCPCKVDDEEWKRFFSDMEDGLPGSDIEAGNLAYVDYEAMGELNKYLKQQ